MILDFEPGDKVVNPKQKDWGIGQVQSIIKGKVTVNFENAGKKVINAKNIDAIIPFQDNVNARNPLNKFSAITKIKKIKIRINSICSEYFIICNEYLGTIFSFQ